MSAENQVVKKPGVIEVVKATRLPFVTASALSVLLAAAWVYAQGLGFDVARALLSLVGVIMLHLGANTLNDYFDWEESDKVNRYSGPFSGGSRAEMEGLFSRKFFLKLSILFFALAGISAVILIILGRPLVLVFGLAGLLGGVLYSARPIQLMSRGFGEVIIFLCFGPLITLGTGYAILGLWAIDFFLVGIPLGLLVANILWINEFPDFEADAAVGKRNLVVLLGTARARYGFLIIFLLFFLTVGLLCITRHYPWWSMAVIAVLPLMIKALRNAWRNHADPEAMLPSQGATIQIQTLAGVILFITVLIDRWV